MRALVSEDRFIELWNQHHSATRVAKAIGCHIGNVNQRKRAIEKRRNIRLLTIDENRPTYDQSMLITADRVEVKLKVKDGIVLVAGDQHYHPGNVPIVEHRACLLTDHEVENR
jgi:hypothetical protein